jgi:hypothetical protein
VDESLQFDVYTDKPTYNMGENVLVRFHLYNMTQDSIIVNSRLALNRPNRIGEVWLDFTGPSGEPVLFTASVNIGDPRGDSFTSLGPSRSVGRQYTLQTYYLMDEPGEYTLSGTYNNKWSGEDAEGLNAWTGTLDSRTWKFNIEESAETGESSK